MLVGSIFLGKVKEINNQWIETKFFVLGLPLFPTSSMLVVSKSHGSRQGLTIPLNATSIIAGYGRVLSLLIGGICLIIGASGSNAGLGNNGPTTSIIGVAFIALWAFFYFKFGKPTEAEIAQRSRLGQTIGLYALPNWFDFDGAMKNLNSLQFHYKDKFENSDWKKDLDTPDLPPAKLPMLYPLALFNYLIDSSPENAKLLYSAESRIQ